VATNRRPHHHQRPCCARCKHPSARVHSAPQNPQASCSKYWRCGRRRTPSAPPANKPGPSGCANTPHRHHRYWLGRVIMREWIGDARAKLTSGWRSCPSPVGTPSFSTAALLAR
jgi:hypothetical protein